MRRQPSFRPPEERTDDQIKHETYSKYKLPNESMVIEEGVEPTEDYDAEQPSFSKLIGLSNEEVRDLPVNA